MSATVRTIHADFEGRLIPVLIAIRDSRKLMIHQHTQQPGFEKFGPGILILHNCTLCAFYNARDVDFGSGRSEYNGMFTNSEALECKNRGLARALGAPRRVRWLDL